MQRKTEVTLALVVLIALFVALFLLLRKPEEVQETTVNDTPTTRVRESADVPKVDPADVPTDETVSATTIARTFVERFGSYSTESGYENIDDVLPLATDELRERLEDLAEDARESASSSYYGVSTRIISLKVESEGASAMTLLVTTQREEAFDTPGNTSVKYQDIRLALVRESDDWLVDDFTWVE